MGFLDSVGAGNFFGSINWDSLGWGVLIVLGIAALFIVAGVVAFIYYSTKLKKAAFTNLIVIYQEVNGKLYRVGTDNAKEMFVPDTNISLYFLKNRKLYIAKPTRAMGKNEYWYKVLPNGEWVNFDMSTHPQDSVLAIANYDHRDTRYAYTNLKEIIKRNYTSKSIPWWKDPVIMNIIAFVIMAFIFVLGCWFLIAKIASVVDKIAPLAEQLKIISQNQVEAAKIMQSLNSGVILS